MIGGTGPTGPHVVSGLIQRGYRVSILHTGTHEVDVLPEDVEHIHTDPFSVNAVREALGDREFDLVIVNYGRLRDLAEFLSGRVGRFVSVGGVPVYRGYGSSDAVWPRGMPVPTREDAELAGPEENPHVRKIPLAEQSVFEFHPGATHFRYPLIYGPRQHIPREWLVVRRILDGGLTLRSCAYAENAAHAVLLAVDQPEVAEGRIYNVGDEQTPSLRQLVEIISQALEYSWEIIELPADLAVTARPLLMTTDSHHLVTDVGRLVHELGYRDRVSMVDAISLTARWLVENPVVRGGSAEQSMQDRFDYAAEDALVEAWRTARSEVEGIARNLDPGYRAHYARDASTRVPRLGTRVE